MRLPRTLWTALWREIAANSALGLGAVALVYLASNLLRYAGRLFGLGAGPGDVAHVAGCVLLVMGAHALPIAFLFGLAVALSRMAADAEILALRACGVGQGALVAPLLALALAVSGATAVASLDLEPRARRELREAFHALAVRAALLEPGRFRELDGRTLFARERAADGGLVGVFVADRSQPERPFVLFAERGSLRWDAAAARMRLHLVRGDVVFERPADAPRDDAPARMSFESLDYAFAPDELLGAGPGDLLPKDMSLAELREIVARARAGGSLDGLEKPTIEHYELQIQRRYALPAAPLVLALVAAPLALRPGRAARARGALLCAALTGGYYAAFVAARAVALAGGLPALAAPWLPNAAFAALGLGLLARARHLPAG
jgi:lipopolysaccharide export system permease protein